MSEFDPSRAAREELASLADVLKTMRQFERAAEAAISIAESELNAVRKLRGFCEIEMDRVRERLAVIEAKEQT